MYVERHGSGPESYFGLHGWGSNRDSFAPLIRRMPEGATFYSADLPGCGRSPAPREWSLTAFADEIAAAISETEAAQLTVIGNCSGAIFGLLAAGQVKERIKRMILIDPFAYVPWYFKVFVRTSFGRYAYYSTFANPVGRWLTNLSLRRRRTADTDLTESFSAADHESVYRQLALLSEVDGITQFRDLSMPIDLVYGERTFGAVKRSIGLWQSLWPRARRWELKGAGHLPIEEATEELGKIVFSPARERANAMVVEAGSNIPVQSAAAYSDD